MAQNERETHFAMSYPSGMITDEELIAIYLYCVAFEEKYRIKSIHKHIKNHLHSWFSLFPSYQAFNIRFNNLCDAFPILLANFINKISLPSDGLKVLLGDSFPVTTFFTNEVEM